MKARKIILIAGLVLLGPLCVLGTILAFCSVADPAMFQTVTAPAAALSAQAEAGAQRAGAAAGKGLRALHSALTVTRELLAPGPQVQPLPGPEPPVHREPLPGATHLIREQGREVLTGGVEIFYYNQKDALWAQAGFGDDPVGIYGCGPTALAMAVSSLTEVGVNPAEMAEWCGQQGYQAPKSGSYLTIVGGVAERYSLGCESLPVEDAQALLDGLAEGGVAVALMGPGHFTNTGHFILLHGVTADGQVLVADPNSREKSLVPWDPRIILSELSESRSGGSPLWLLRNTPA